jgi:acetolactate synthase-1/2/3 large subunit
MTVGDFIVETLVAHGIDRIFCVPGESYLGLLDALHGRREIDTVVCRHEGGAGFMALADARLTGRPGIVCVSRGPGASNAAIAVHTAQQDAVPLIVIVGQVGARDVRRDSFQEIDYCHMFGAIAKWTAEVVDPARMPETLLRAMQVATTGTPGPVVIAVPEDVLTAPLQAEHVQPQALVSAAPDPRGLETLRAAIARADRPLVIAGSQIERPDAREKLLAFLEAWNLPSVVSFRRQDLLPNGHRLYAGDMGLANPEPQMAVLRDCDLLIVLGAWLSDITTQGYVFPRLVRPAQMLVHVHADPAALGTHFACDLAMACSPVAMMDAIGAPPARLPDRRGWIERLAAERRKITAVRSPKVSDGVPFELVVDTIGRHLPPDGIITLDAGSFAAPAYRIVRFTPPQRLLAPISGAMGFGVPAAVAAALREPRRTIVSLVGDGGFLMTGGELALAIERDLPIKLFLAENRSYGSIRIHQERDYPGRVVGTSFANPDFALMGQAYGGAVTRIATPADVDRIPALLAAPGLQFVVVETSLQAVLPASRT